MNPPPVERLETKLARVAKEQGVAQERLRRWVSFLALCGVLERAEASQYRKWAEALQLDWPRTTALLESIASSFEETARLHDETAEKTQWMY